MTNNNEQIFVGVEGGGTKTSISIVQMTNDKSLKILYQDTINQQTNPVQSSIQEVTDFINQQLLQIITSLNLKEQQVKYINLTISGINSSQNLQQYFKNFTKAKVSSFNDTYAALPLLNSKYKGIAIAGTGNSFLLQLYQTEPVLLCAYGHQLTEQFSAYSATKRYVTRCLDGIDGIENEYSIVEYLQFYSFFAKEMEINCDCKHQDLINLFYSNNKKLIASFSKQIYLQCVSGQGAIQQFCLNILKQEIQYFIKQLKSAVNKCKINNQYNYIDIYLIGSFFKIFEIKEIKEYFNSFDELNNIKQYIKFYQGKDNACSIGASLLTLQNDQIDHKYLKDLLQINEIKLFY